MGCSMGVGKDGRDVGRVLPQANGEAELSLFSSLRICFIRGSESKNARVRYE